MIFDITDMEVSKTGLFRKKTSQIAFVAKARAKDVIGFQAVIPTTNWKYQEHESGLKLYWGEMKLRSIGQETDELLSTYNRHFGIAATRAQAEMPCKAVFLKGAPSSATADSARLKLFFGDDSVPGAPSYGEVYLNFDLPERRAALREKDPEYRKALVAWIAGASLAPENPDV